jgi:hypothetical protein
MSSFYDLAVSDENLCESASIAYSGYLSLTRYNEKIMHLPYNDSDQITGGAS